MPTWMKRALTTAGGQSKTEPIRAYTAANENYIEWLAKAAKTSHDALRLQQGFSAGVPTALLYLMLHHALDLSFIETSIRLFLNAGLIDQTQFRAAKREPAFIQVREASLADPVAAGGSRLQYLLRHAGTDGRSVHYDGSHDDDHHRLPETPARRPRAPPEAAHRGAGAGVRRASRPLLLPLRRVVRGLAELPAWATALQANWPGAGKRSWWSGRQHRADIRTLSRRLWLARECEAG